MRVMFVHPAYPNQFTRIAHYMGSMQGMECSFLVDRSFSGQVCTDRVPITYYGYSSDNNGNGEAAGYFYTSTYEDAVRHGKGIADTLAPLLQTHPVDVVVGHASFGATFFIKELLHIPVISYVELPGYYMAYCRSEFPVTDDLLFLNTTFKSLVYNSVLHSDLTIVPSCHAKKFFPEELQSGIRVRMEGFQPPDIHQDRQKLKKALGLPSGGAIVGFAGRTLEAMRGFDIFVRVAAKLKKARGDIHFLVIGDEETIYGNEQAYLPGKSFKKHVLDAEGLNEDFFIFRNFLPYDDFTRHLQAMDVILFPLFEGAANWSLFEAMASGLKIIASNACFIPEVITSGKEGYLSDPYDTECFVEKTLQILSDPGAYSFLGINARKKIEQDYSVEKAVSGYKAIMEEVMLKKVRGQDRINA